MLDIRSWIFCFVLLGVLTEIGEAYEFYEFQIPKHNPKNCSTWRYMNVPIDHVCVYKDGEYLNFKSERQREIAACFDDSFIRAYNGLCREGHTFETMYTGQQNCGQGRICATNNVTYYNLCELYTEKDRTNDRDLRPKHDGRCREDET